MHTGTPNPTSSGSVSLGGRRRNIAGYALVTLLSVLSSACPVVAGGARYLVGDEVQLLKSSLGCEQPDVADNARRILAFGDEEDRRLFYGEHASTCREMASGTIGLVKDASLQYDLSCLQISDEPICLWFQNQCLLQS